MTRLVLLLLTAALTNFVLAAAPDDNLIVPGQRISKWTLEMSIEDLESLNGPAQRIALSAGGGVSLDAIRDLSQHLWRNVGLAAATFDGKRVEVLAAGVAGTNPPYRTELGVGILSSPEALARAYGTPTAQTRPMTGQIRLIYDHLGFYARLLEGGAITEIGVFRTGSAKTLWKF